MSESAKWDVVWNDAGELPKQVPDLRYPTGVDLDVSDGKEPACVCQLPYPAKRIGAFFVGCKKCGVTALVSTAGRFDDPRSIKFACGVKPEKTKVLIAPHKKA